MTTAANSPVPSSTRNACSTVLVGVSFNEHSVTPTAFLSSPRSFPIVRVGGGVWQGRKTHNRAAPHLGAPRVDAGPRQGSRFRAGKGRRSRRSLIVFLSLASSGTAMLWTWTTRVQSSFAGSRARAGRADRDAGDAHLGSRLPGRPRLQAEEGGLLPVPRFVDARAAARGLRARSRIEWTVRAGHLSRGPRGNRP